MKEFLSALLLSFCPYYIVLYILRSGTSLCPFLSLFVPELPFRTENGTTGTNKDTALSTTITLLHCSSVKICLVYKGTKGQGFSHAHVRDREMVAMLMQGRS